VVESARVTPIHSPLPRSTAAFVGRLELLDRLRLLVDDEAVFIVHGLPGIGKTELLYKFVGELRAQEPWANATALRVAATTSGGASAVIGELAVLAGCEHAEPTTDPGLAALAATLDQQQALVIIDDAQNAQPEELAAFLGYVGRRLHRARLLVATRRAIPLPSELPGIVFVHVDPLTADEALALAEKLVLRRGLQHVDTASVAERSAGVPLFLMRALADADDNGMMVELVDILSALTETESQFLLVAGLVGHVDNTMLATVLGMSAAQVATLARRLSDEALLSRGRGHVPLVVSRALIGLQVSDAVRARSTWRVMAALSQREDAVSRSPVLLGYLDALAQVLTEHVADMAEMRATALIHRADVRGARAALAETARNTSVEAELSRATCEILEARFAAAREHIAQVHQRASAPDHEPRALLLESMVEAIAGEGAASRQLVQTARESGASLDESAWRLCQALSYMCDERFAKASPRLADHGAQLPAAGLAILAHIEQDKTDAAVHIASQLDMATTGACTESRQLHSALQGVVAWATGDMGRARDLLRTAQRHFTENRAMVLVPLIGEYLARSLLALGELEEAYDVFAKSAQSANAGGMVGIAQRSYTARGATLIAMGQPRRARRYLDVALNEQTTVGRRTKAAAIHSLAYARALEGDLPYGRALLEESRSNATAAGDAVGARVDLAAVELEMLGGDAALAIGPGRRARRHFGEARRAWFETRAALALAAAYVSRGGDADLLAAEKELARSRGHIDAHGYRSLNMLAALVNAAVCKRRGDDVACLRTLSDGLRDAQTIGGFHLTVQALRAALEPDVPQPELLEGVRGILVYLGFTSTARFVIIDHVGKRDVSANELERERARRELTVDLRTNTIGTRTGATVKGRPTACRLLARLIEAGPHGMDAASLYREVWRSESYDRSKNRNTLHVALNRLRQSVAELLGERTAIATLSNGWCVPDEVDACVIDKP